MQFNELLRYDPVTGRLFWKKRPLSMFSRGGHAAKHNMDKWNARWADQEAFTAIKKGGYRHGAIRGVTYLAHRVIWKMQTGKWPEEIDHIDGNSSNNAWSNLRSVSRRSNRRNSARQRQNQSGVTGVRRTNRGGWQAFITVNYKMICLGSSQKFEEAVRMRKEAEIRYGFHPNHGRNPAA
jgi:HNH endonuclease